MKMFYGGGVLKKILISIITFFSLFLSISEVNSYGQERSYSIDQIRIHASVNNAGDLIVSENLIYNFKGDFNGINRNIVFSGGSEINNITINVIKNGTALNVKKSSGGEDNTVQESTEGSTKKLKIYSKSSNEIKEFNINYTVLGAATRYNDISELFWKFYENSSNVDIKNIYLEVEFPNTSSMESKFWGIGPSTGNSKKIGENKFSFTLPNLFNGQYIGCRIIFPLQYLSQGRKVVNETAYNRILNEQTQNQYNNNSEPNPNHNYQSNYDSESNHNNSIRNNYYDTVNPHKDNSIVIPLLIVLVIGGIIYYFIVSNKVYNEALKEYRGDIVFFSDEYCLEPPSNMSPALVSYILNKNVKMNDIIATLIDLRLRGILTSNNTEDLGKDIEDNLNYEFKINNNKISLCSSQEEFLINWLSSYGNEPGYFTLQDIKNATKQTADIHIFKDSFYKWSNLIIEEFNSKNIYVDIKGRKVISNAYYNEYLKWKAFRNYLENYRKENEDTICDEDYWKRLLPYIICFNVINSLIEFAPNLDSRTNNYDPLFYNPYYMNYFFYNFVNSMENNVNPPSNSNNFNSNNFGDGGGFTSGGDSGSCGGGGGSDAF